MGSDMKYIGKLLNMGIKVENICESRKFFMKYLLWGSGVEL